MSSPWADPSAPAGYAGPPVTAPPAFAPPAAYAAPGWPAGPGWPGYPPGLSPWGPPAPPRPRRPGPVTTAAVLGFVQAGVVALSSAYVLLLASTLGTLAVLGGESGSEAESLVTEATVLCVVQLVSAAALVVGGVLALTRHGRVPRGTLLAALGAQLAIALYWAVRLLTLDGLTDGVSGPGPVAVLLVLVLFYAVLPGVGVGLLLARDARRWFDGAGPAAG
ncbi:hypothetical protein SAMN05660690_3404 [Geodermatophilus telluris]|uniref:Uncharacterized protein n=1 Tax=Geodermatophilus telluris TaxID=1190417 RepID=A0A1G6S1E1_9ACTN|nr:hypothetical protein [Geodermatophilus telluris]SDD10494.1 hypothetical protein SAMN05660690_3404 [Geodermatophilus telluris]